MKHLQETIGNERYKDLLERRYNRVLNRARKGRMPKEEADKILDRIEGTLGYVPRVHFEGEIIEYNK